MRIEDSIKFPVRRFMEHKGFRVWYEVDFMGKTIDLACFKSPRTTTSIEAKIHNFDQAIYQASVYRLWSDYSYVALPRSAQVGEAHYDLIHREGLGLLRVQGGRKPTAEEEVRPRRNQNVVGSRKRDLIEKLASSKERGGTLA